MTHEEMEDMILNVINLNGPINTLHLMISLMSRVGPAKLNTILVNETLDKIVKDGKIKIVKYTIPEDRIFNRIPITSYLYFPENAIIYK